MIRGQVRPNENNAVLLLTIRRVDPNLDVAGGLTGRSQKSFHSCVTSNSVAEQRQYTYDCPHFAGDGTIEASKQVWNRRRRVSWPLCVAELLC